MTIASVALAAGLGLTVDTVLLVALAERRNRAARQMWMVTLAAAAWCWHAGAGGYFLLEGDPSADVHQLRWASMTLMVVGLLAMPCSLLHAVVRLTTSGWFNPGRHRGYEPLLYAPVLLSVPIAFSLQGPSSDTFLQQVNPLVLPYLGAITAISLLAAVVIWRAAATSALPAGPRFLRTLSLALMTMAAVLNVIMLVVMPLWPHAYVWWCIVLVILPLVLERTVVYGGILAGLVLVHRSVVAPLEAAWEPSIGIELLWIELALGVVLVVSYQPARRRVHEALRYLTSGTVRRFRREVRGLAVELSAPGGTTPAELLEWFLPKLLRLPGVGEVQMVVSESRSANRWEAASVTLCDADVVGRLSAEMAAARLHAVFFDQAPSRWCVEVLLRGRVTAVVRTEFETLQNVWLLRAAPGDEIWGDEELNSLVLLAEQCAAAVRHCLLQAARATAERRAWQAEKLSALGLLAGSLAHEIKNPLSSIKTLATVALEDSDPQSEHAESLRLIRQEIDRLAHTTQQLLGYVRSDSSTEADSDLADAVAATLQIAGHRARQQCVTLQAASSNGAVRVRAPREAIQSVLLNLVLNAIEACPGGGSVTVSIEHDARRASIEVRDTGSGIPAEIQDRLFMPLNTTKPDGTGLGLYSAAQTVRDLGGEISVESSLGNGTVFRVILPLTG